MPELPEVETVTRGLESRIVGKTIADFEARNKKSFIAQKGFSPESIKDAKVKSVSRYQKMVLIELSINYFLVVHLKMTGQLVYQALAVSGQGLEKKKQSNSKDLSALNASFAGGHPEKSYETELPNKHTHIIFTFKDGSHLYFNDLRKFGWIKAIPKESLEEFLAKFAYSADPLTPEWLFDEFVQKAQRKSVSAKQFLMDQKIAAGVGNIYADEALFDARVSPLKKAKDLSSEELKRIFNSVKKVFKKGIEYGGTTKSDYRNIDGSAGKMQNHLMVYGRYGEPCKKCDGTIERIKLGGRSTHYCPKCQV